MKTIPKFFANKTSDATGRPIARAVSAPEPVVIANAVPSTVPEIISGGILAPIENAPIKASSIVAPIFTPVSISPMTIPVNIPMIIGRESRHVPSRYSALPSIATRPNNIA